jgi:predicted dehydrogenase/aryl-alcohol dehydrogenase-like predicted oxidoreductase
MSSRLQWGILGTGNIAKAFAKGLAASKTGRLVAVASRSKEKADQFGTEFGVKHCHGSYEALLADKDVQAVYIATPHPMHAEWAIKAAEAGKHILCEKPIGINHAEAMAIVEAAQQNDVFLMEAFMYRCHPQIRKLVELLRAKAIGEVRLIRASFGFNAGYMPEHRLFSNALGGGGILDVGCYAASMSRLAAGAAQGKDFAEPIDVRGMGHLCGTGVDGWAIGELQFPGGLVAQIAAAIQLTMDNQVQIFGSDGSLVIPDPWIPNRDGGSSKILLQAKEKTEEIVVEAGAPLYTLEADTVAAHIDRRQAASPAMTWDDTLGNMRTLDRWREAVGVVYDSEKFETCSAWTQTRPLAPRKDRTMKYGRLEGVTKPISRLIMGVDNITTMPHIFTMFDDFVERGGNTFDTAWIYGYDGACEKALGQWVKKRGVREEVVLLDKGAHTPCCTPEHLTSQLKESLERLQSDYMDIYMMHRDNLAVPVGEFVEVLNEHLRAGRMRAFGGSNWTWERVEAFNAYAKKKGLKGFAAVSNNFSLARMVGTTWGGCLASSEPEFRAWHLKTQMPLLAWSSQARGFFVRGDPLDRSDSELVHWWYSDDNFQRLERARQMAKKRGVPLIQIALAYVLNQPFPTFPLIGPRSLAETRTSFGALDIDLGPEDLAWLNLER